MVKVLSDASQSPLQPGTNDVRLGPGDRGVISMSGVAMNLKRADVARYNVPEEQAREVAERHLSHMDVVMREVSAYAAIVLAFGCELELPALVPSGMLLRETLAIADLPFEELAADPQTGLGQLSQRRRALAEAKVTALIAERRGG